jgi:hypothetical protein
VPGRSTPSQAQHAVEVFRQRHRRPVAQRSKVGIIPMYQKITEIDAYAETANTSQANGERNCGHTFIVFG